MNFIMFSILTVDILEADIIRKNIFFKYIIILIKLFINNTHKHIFFIL